MLVNIENKIKKCDNLLHILVNVKDKNNIPCERYYKVLAIWQNIKKIHNEELNKKDRSVCVEKPKCYFDLPELKITSTTYERAKRRLEKQIDERFKNR